jgi:hypothetical protein
MNGNITLNKKEQNVIRGMFLLIFLLVIVIFGSNLNYKSQIRELEQERAEIYNNLTLIQLKERVVLTEYLTSYFTSNCQRHLTDPTSWGLESERQYDYIYICLETTEIKMSSNANHKDDKLTNGRIEK